MLEISKLGFSLDWFLTGEGPMYRDEQPIKPKNDLSVVPAHYILPSEVSEGSFVVPVLEQELAAGESSIPDDENRPPVAYIELPTTMRRYGRSLTALSVRGDSMYPTIHHGDMVVCDTGGWQGDGIYAIRLRGECLLKRLAFDADCVKVISDNPVCPSFDVSDQNELDVVGKVRTVVREIG